MTDSEFQGPRMGNAKSMSMFSHIFFLTAPYQKDTEFIKPFVELVIE